MRTGAIQIAVLAWLLLGQTAAACDTTAGRPDESPLHTRKPVLGDEVRLTSGFGMRRHPILNVAKMHTGIDWAAPIGTPVVAAGGGRVIFAGVEGEYGRTVLIDHGAGWRTRYAHLSGFDVREGDCVSARAVIGRVGSTGLAPGPILHFEVHRNGYMIDPLSIPSSEPTPVEEESK